VKGKKQRTIREPGKKITRVVGSFSSKKISGLGERVSEQKRGENGSGKVPIVGLSTQFGE